MAITAAAFGAHAARLALVVVAKKASCNVLSSSWRQGFNNAADAAISTPVLICHGTADNCILGVTTAAQLTRDKLDGPYCEGFRRGHV